MDTRDFQFSYTYYYVYSSDQISHSVVSDSLRLHGLHAVYTVRGVLKTITLKWVAIPFSSEPHVVRTLHHDPSVLGGPAWFGS